MTHSPKSGKAPPLPSPSSRTPVMDHSFTRQSVISVKEPFSIFVIPTSREGSLFKPGTQHAALISPQSSSKHSQQIAHCQLISLST